MQEIPVESMLMNQDIVFMLLTAYGKSFLNITNVCDGKRAMKRHKLKASACLPDIPIMPACCIKEIYNFP